MVDFHNKAIIKLKEVNIKENNDLIKDVIIEGEEVLLAFSSMRDKLFFTNRRLISVNVQGITGAKKDFTSIPYSKIQVYSIETAGMLDFDAELDITISGLGTVRFELKSSTNMKNINKILSEAIL